jgi:RNA polymerase sigma-B factor
MVVGGRPGDAAGAGPVVTDQELAALVQSLPRADPRRDRACELLVARHQDIVDSCVRRYRNVPDLAEDLAQVGYVGLMKAINNFDPAVGDSLAAFAQPCVSGEIKRYFRDKRWQVRVRRPDQELGLEIRKAAAELTQNLSRAPRDDELAEYLHVREADVASAQLASQAFQAAYLDAPLTTGDDGFSLADLLGQDDTQIEHAVDMDAVWAHWPELPPREQELLAMRFYGNMTQAEIGDKLGISQMHVSRLLRRALGYLRERLTEPAA